MEIEASSYLSSAAVQPGLCWRWSNYRLFSHGVDSYMFNEESDNVVLEYRFTHYVDNLVCVFTGRTYNVGFCCLIGACSILMNRALRKPRSL